jgi:hypothetical protein
MVSVTPRSIQDEGMMQAYNLIFRKALQSLLTVRVRRKYFSNQPIDLPDSVVGQIQILQGFGSEVAFKMFGQASKLVLNLDPISKVLSLTTALDLIYELKGNDSWENKSAQRRIRKEMIDSVVVTRYNYEHYTIEDIDFDQTPEGTFEWVNRRTGKKTQITYADYLRETKNIEITDYDQPMLKTRGRNRGVIYIIPETCLLTDIDPYSKRELPKICSVKPPEREKRFTNIISLLKTTGSASEKVLNAFKVLLKPDPIKVKAKLLKAPVLDLPGKGPFSVKGEWRNESKNSLKWSGKPTDSNLYVIYDEHVEDFAKEWTQRLRKVGMFTVV